VVRGRHPADRRRRRCRGLHHAERGVRAHVVVDAFAAAAAAANARARVSGIVSHPQRGAGRPVFDPFHRFVTGFPLDRISAAAAAATAAPPPRVLRTVPFPVRATIKK